MPSCSNRWPVRSVWVGPLLLAMACTAPEAFTGDGLGNGGSGGSIVPGSGGAIGSGGSLGSGGATGSGGVSGTGGRIGSGGALGTGGRTGTGGSVGTGGAIGTGGTVATGGATGTGGRVGTGGAVGSGGAIGTGGAGGGPSGTVLFFDNFETGNASQWVTTVPSTDWSIVTDGTLVYKEGATLSSATRLSAVASVGNDIVVEARVKVLAFAGQSTSYQAEICARMLDSTTFYYAALDSTGKVAIKKNTATASNTTLASVADGIVTNTWYTVRFQVVGSTLTAYVNGVQKVTTTDTEIASGGFGVGTRNATVEFDDVRVTVP